MILVHKKCGGIINKSNRTCSKCSRKWNIISFLFTPTDIRLVNSRINGEVKPIKKGTTSYAKWGDYLPGVAQVASRLPNWPRWLRVLSVLITLGVTVGLIIILVSSC